MSMGAPKGKRLRGYLFEYTVTCYDLRWFSTKWVAMLNNWSSCSLMGMPDCTLSTQRLPGAVQVAKPGKPEALCDSEVYDIIAFYINFSIY